MHAVSTFTLDKDGLVILFDSKFLIVFLADEKTSPEVGITSVCSDHTKVSDLPFFIVRLLVTASLLHFSFLFH